MRNRRDGGLQPYVPVAIRLTTSRIEACTRSVTADTCARGRLGSQSGSCAGSKPNGSCSVWMVLCWEQTGCPAPRRSVLSWCKAATSRIRENRHRCVPLISSCERLTAVPGFPANPGEGTLALELKAQLLACHTRGCVSSGVHVHWKGAAQACQLRRRCEQVRDAHSASSLPGSCGRGALPQCGYLLRPSPACLRTCA